MKRKRNSSDDVDMQDPSPSTSGQVNDKGKEAVTAATTDSPVIRKPHHDQRDSDETESDSEGTEVSDSDREEDTSSWISWFCSLKRNKFLCEVDVSYIKDEFNLYGISDLVPYYKNALDLILDVESPDGQRFTEQEHRYIDTYAEVLYGLIHARYIVTCEGLAKMCEKYKNYHFGACPRVYCSGQPCLPVGPSDLLGHYTVKIYCPKCEDVYYPRSKYQKHTNGAYFGRTFPHLFLMTYQQLKLPKATQNYVPRVFGFKVHKP